jgi:hypothetical protein
VFFRFAVVVACSLPGVSAHAARARPQADVAVMRENRGEIAASVTSAIDAALLRALGEVVGIRKPRLSPVDYGEVQLTVGCSDELDECLAAITHIAEADAIVVRDLFIDQGGAVTLRILYFDEAGGPAQVQLTLPADHVQELAQAVPGLVKKLFEIPEPAAQNAVATAKAQSSLVPSSVNVSAPPTTDRGASISTLSWVALATGAAVLGTGVVLGLTTQSDYDAFRSMRVHTREQAQAANRQFSSIETRATAVNVLIPAGAIVLGAGAVLLGIDLFANDSKAEANRASVQMIPLPSGGAVAVHGRFGGAL